MVIRVDFDGQIQAEFPVDGSCRLIIGNRRKQCYKTNFSFCISSNADCEQVGATVATLHATATQCFLAVDRSFVRFYSKITFQVLKLIFVANLRP